MSESNSGSSPWCLEMLQRIITDLVENDRRVGSLQLEAFKTQLEIIYREVALLELLHNGTNFSTALELLRAAITELEAPEDVHVRTGQYEADTERDSIRIRRGRLVTLLEYQFTAPQIADIIGVSLRSVRRRMTEYNLSIRSLYSDINDDQLDAIVEEVTTHFPMCGNRQMQGHLTARGLRVQQERVRESQRRVDPAGTMMRRLRAIQRREYRVNGPLALWHVDGNHRLIR